MIYLKGNFNFPGKKIVQITFIFATIFAISDELHQSFIPGRTASVYDFLADVLGILIALLLHKQIPKIVAKIQIIVKK